MTAIEMTPEGRAAYETYDRALRDPECTVTAAWEAAAQAVLNRAFPRLCRERDEARAEAARLRGLLAEAVNPSAQDYDHAAEIPRLREQLAAQAGFTENPACDAHRWYAVVTHCGSFAYGFSATSDGLRVWDDADEFEYAKARDFE